MSLYEDWMKKAFSQEGRSIEAVWEEYLPKEQKIYEYILGEKVTKLEGTIAELAARFNMTAEMIVAFIDGLNASLEEQFDMETLTEDTKVCINIDFEKLYKLMIEYKAEHLSNLPQWDGIYDAETRKHFALEQKKSKTIVKGEKIGRNDPCPCGSGKKYKKCLLFYKLFLIMALQENKTDQSIAQILNLSYAFRTQRTESSTFRSYQTIYQQNLTIEPKYGQ